MPGQSIERVLIVFFRLAMAWTFLYAASHQVLDPNFSVAGFLRGTKTFHGLYAPLTSPVWAPVLTFFVGYGHLLIGLSLLFGLWTRISAAFGILLMLIYWTAHMDFPYIEDHNNFLLDYHLVYAGVLVWLIYKDAGCIYGVDGWLQKLPILNQHSKLRGLFT